MNDTTILAMLSRHPDIPREEQDEYISKIQHEENVPLCLAVLGRVPREDLTPSARQTFDEFSRWSSDRTRRMKNEQMTDRYRRRENRTAIKMSQLHERGIISDQVLMLYGISGDLPERHVYSQLTIEEKRELWEDRMERRFGPTWRTNIRSVPRMFQETHGGHDWIREGF